MLVGGIDMKVERIISIMLIGGISLSVLSSCSRRNHYEDILESQQESESLAEILEVNGNITGRGAFDYETPIMTQVGETPFYQDMNVESLKELYAQRGFGNYGNTLLPTGKLYNDGTAQGFGFYNKLTGNVGKWCADPLCACNSEECIWAGGIFDILYTSENWIYFIADGYYRTGLYRCDHQRNNIELLDESLVLGEIDSIYCENNGYLYFATPEYRSGTSAGVAVKMMNLTTKEIETLHTDTDDFRVHAVVGETIYYGYGTDQEYILYRTDLSFSSSEEVWKGKTIASYNNEYLILCDEVPSLGGYLDTYTVYRVATGEYIEIPHTKGSNNFKLSGHYVYYVDRVVEEELEGDPFSDYYSFMWLDGKVPNRAMTEGAGKLYRMDILTGKTECVIQLMYKGVPVRITNYEPDGEVVFFTFKTHEEFENYYNHGEFDNSITYVNHYAKADFQDGTLFFIEATTEE